VAASPREGSICSVSPSSTESEADDALLQLAQLDYAGRDPAGTVRWIDRPSWTTLTVLSVLRGALGRRGVRRARPERARRRPDVGSAPSATTRSCATSSSSSATAVAPWSAMSRPACRPARRQRRAGWSSGRGQDGRRSGRGGRPTKRLELPAVITQEAGWLVRSGPLEARVPRMPWRGFEGWAETLPGRTEAMSHES
jgi:hypothetical protein